MREELFVSAAAVDVEPEVDCRCWAAQGQCSANPDFMAANCQASCAEHQQQQECIQQLNEKQYWLNELRLDGEKMEQEQERMEQENDAVVAERDALREQLQEARAREHVKVQLISGLEQLVVDLEAAVAAAPATSATAVEQQEAAMQHTITLEREVAELKLELAQRDAQKVRGDSEFAHTTASMVSFWDLVSSFSSSANELSGLVSGFSYELADTNCDGVVSTPGHSKATHMTRWVGEKPSGGNFSMTSSLGRESVLNGGDVASIASNGLDISTFLAAVNASAGSQVAFSTVCLVMCRFLFSLARGASKQQNRAAYFRAAHKCLMTLVGVILITALLIATFCLAWFALRVWQKSERVDVSWHAPVAVWAIGIVTDLAAELADHVTDLADVAQVALHSIGVSQLAGDLLALMMQQFNAIELRINELGLFSILLRYASSAQLLCSQMLLCWATQLQILDEARRNESTRVSLPTACADDVEGCAAVWNALTGDSISVPLLEMVAAADPRWTIAGVMFLAFAPLCWIFRFGRGPPENRVIDVDAWHGSQQDTLSNTAEATPMSGQHFYIGDSSEVAADLQTECSLADDSPMMPWPRENAFEPELKSLTSSSFKRVVAAGLVEPPSIKDLRKVAHLSAAHVSIAEAASRAAPQVSPQRRVPAFSIVV